MAPTRVDFLSGATTHRRRYGGGRSQLIAKAVGLKSKTIRHHQPLNVVDLTAGLGQDGFVLATLGCSVTLVERSAIVYQLLSDGFHRALQFAVAPQTVDDKALANTLARMNLVEGSAENYLKNLAAPPDIIYLDPMFPDRGKSAKINKHMQALQMIVGNDEDTGKLLSLALNKVRFRVVVKRPRKAMALDQQYPQMALPKPGKVLMGSSTRYDVYFSTST